MPSAKPTSYDDTPTPMTTPHQATFDETDAAFKARVEAAKKEFRRKVDIDTLPPEHTKEFDDMIEQLESIKVMSERQIQWREGYNKRVDDYCGRVDRLTVGPDSYKANLDDCLQEADECIEAMNELSETRQKYRDVIEGNLESQSKQVRCLAVCGIRTKKHMLAKIS
jgi:uncharacterized coiled-coil DUF342 family protein